MTTNPLDIIERAISKTENKIGSVKKLLEVKKKIGAKDDEGMEHIFYLETVLTALTKFREEQAKPSPTLEGLKLSLRHYSVGGTPKYNYGIKRFNAALDLPEIKAIARKAELFDSLKPMLDELVAAREKATQEGEWQTRFLYRLFKAAKEHPDYLSDSTKDQDWNDSEFIATAANLTAEISKILKGE